MNQSSDGRRGIPFLCFTHIGHVVSGLRWSRTHFTHLPPLSYLFPWLNSGVPHTLADVCLWHHIQFEPDWKLLQLNFCIRDTGKSRQTLTVNKWETQRELKATGLLSADTPNTVILVWFSLSHSLLIKSFISIRETQWSTEALRHWASVPSPDHTQLY